MEEDLRKRYIKRLNGNGTLTKSEALKLVHEIITEVNQVKISRKTHNRTIQAKRKQEREIQILKTRIGAYKKAIKMLGGEKDD